MTRPEEGFPVVEISTEVPAAYVLLRKAKIEGQVELPTKEMGLMLIVDVDDAGKAIGVEILW